eukprot:12422053-Karenia_brevis.AAC.1
MDANLDQNFVCILNSLLLALGPNMASKRLPTLEGGGFRSGISGLRGSWRLLEGSWGLLWPKIQF